jgi:hypothetical protein
MDCIKNIQEIKKFLIQDLFLSSDMKINILRVAVATSELW